MLMLMLMLMLMKLPSIIVGTSFIRFWNVITLSDDINNWTKLYFLLVVGYVSVLRISSSSLLILYLSKVKLRIHAMPCHAIKILGLALTPMPVVNCNESQVHPM